MVFDGGLFVVKFGGKALSNGLRIRKAAEMVADAFKKGNKPVVVVSAMGDVTDGLIHLAKEASEGKISADCLDDILSMGERTSVRVFASVLKAFGLNSIYLDPSMESWPIITDNRFGNANPLIPLTYERIRNVLRPLIEKNIIPIIPGFVGKTLNGRVTTLGRGGSDITALLVSKALGFKEVILVSDVDGVMTGDPKIVSKPRVLREVDVKTLAGLTDSGVKFIKSKTLKYKTSDIDVRLIGFRYGSLDAEGTVIKGSISNPSLRFKVEAHREPIAALTVVGKGVTSKPEVLVEVFKAVKDAGVQPLGVSMDSDSIIFYIPEPKSVEAAKKVHSIVLESQNSLIAVALKKGLALISVKGFGLEETPGVISKISNPLREQGINIHGMFTITSSVNLILDLEKAEFASKLIENSLNGGEENG